MLPSTMKVSSGILIPLSIIKILFPLLIKTITIILLNIKLPCEILFIMLDLFNEISLIRCLSHPPTDSTNNSQEDITPGATIPKTVNPLG